jgi:hypothetical protein
MGINHETFIECARSTLTCIQKAKVYAATRSPSNVIERAFVRAEGPGKVE